MFLCKSSVVLSFRIQVELERRLVLNLVSEVSHN